MGMINNHYKLVFVFWFLVHVIMPGMDLIDI